MARDAGERRPRIALSPATPTPHDKFLAWARTVPFTLAQSALSLDASRTEALLRHRRTAGRSAAPAIWERANEQLQTSSDLTAQGILRKFKVRAVCTTDDPCDDLAHHRAVNHLERRLSHVSDVPPRRGPRRSSASSVFNAWVSRLESASNIEILSFSHFLDALKQRHDHFHSRRRPPLRPRPHALLRDALHRDAGRNDFRESARGPARDAGGTRAVRLLSHAVSSDVSTRKRIGRSNCTSARCATSTPARPKHSAPTPATTTLAIGRKPKRSANTSTCSNRKTRCRKRSSTTTIPSTITFFRRRSAAFRTERTPGKIQFGSGWWFLDQKEGIEWQLNALSNNGLFSPVRRHAHRLALVHVVPAPRIFPPRALQSVGQ